MEGISGPFIRRPVMTTLLMLAILIAGFSAYMALPVSDLPNVDYPVIQVEARLAGASPEVMANTIASPLEREFMSISSLKVVHSSSSYGYASLTLEFDAAKKMDSAAQDVEAAISRAMPNLPSTMKTKPTYYKQNPSQEPILFFALTSSTMTLPQLFEYGDQVIGKRFSMLEGVAHVEVYGPKRRLDVRLDPLALAAKNLDMEQVKQVIIESNPHLPSGQLVGDVNTITLNTKGQLEKKEEYKNLIVKSLDGSAARIDDIGTVEDGPRPELGYFRYVKGEIDQPTVVLAVQRLPGANTVQVSKEIHDLLPIVQKELPQSISLVTIYDKADSIRESIGEVQLTLLLAILLVVAIIYIYLGRAADTLIPSIVLPISIIGTFFFIYWFGYSLDNLSLLALTLCIGFVVDDAIVVIENIVRHIEEGRAPFQAALQGSKEISFTVLSMTLSLVASFIPLVFMGGLVGKVFREFAVTLSVSILLSGFISLTLTPMLAARFLSRNRSSDRSALARLGDAFNNATLYFYKSVLRLVLVRRGVVWGLAIGSFALLVILFKVLPMEFIPGDDIGYLFVNVKTREGLSQKLRIERQQQVSRILRDPAVEEFITWVGGASGSAFVRLKPLSSRETTKTVVKRLNEKLGKVPGIRPFVSSIPLLDFSLNEGGDNRYHYRLRGSDYQEVVKYTHAMAERLRSVAGLEKVTTNLELNKPQLDIEISRDRSSIYAVSAQSIEIALLDAYANRSITTIELPSAQYDVTFGLADEYQKNPHALDKLHINSKRNYQVPLSSVSEWEEKVGPKQVHHTNRFPSSSIAFTVSDKISLDKALAVVKKTAREILPSTILGKMEGAAEVFEETTGYVLFLLMIAVLVSYFVLGTLYESFIHPITILSTLPLAMLGGLITLLLFGEPLSLFSLVGLVLLIGIIKKNGIIMVDHAIEARSLRNKSAYEAIYEAALVRFRPIMMTTFAAVMGAMPIAVGFGISGGVRRPLGLVIVGGLLISQMFTLFLVPVVYLAFDSLEAKFKRKKQN